MRSVLALLMLVCSPIACWSAPLAVGNADFEAVTGTNTTFFDGSGRLRQGFFVDFETSFGLGNGFISANAIPQWTHVPASGSAGTQHSGGPPTLTVGTNGPNSAYSNRGDIRHTVVGEVVSAGTYTLLVDVGRFNQGGFLLDYTISLLAGTTAFATAANPIIPPAGSYAEASLVVTVPLSSPFLGQQLGIELAATRAQTNWDNVRLDFVPVPEPAMAWLAALALLPGRVRHRPD